MTLLIGPARCGGCRTPVYFLRELGWSEPTARKDVPWMRHQCARGARCDRPLRGGDRCARRRGHLGSHRTRHAMDNALIAWRAR